MSLFCLFLVGIVIGSAMIIPGVSGAVIAVIFGVYDKLIDSLMNLFKEFKKNFIFLFILGIGIILGAIWFSNVLVFLYNKHEIITKFCFAGLILGGIPFLKKEVNKKTNDKLNYVAVGITCFISLIFFFFSKSKLDFYVISTSSFFEFFAVGIIYSIGKVIPGVSSSFLLIIIDKYEFVLSLFANPISIFIKEFNYVFPFLIGLLIGIVVLINLLNFLLKKYFALIYSIIIGFVITSSFSLIPKFYLSIDYVLGVFCMVCGFILSYKLTK